MDIVIDLLPSLQIHSEQDGYRITVAFRDTISEVHAIEAFSSYWSIYTIKSTPDTMWGGGERGGG